MHWSFIFTYYWKLIPSSNSECQLKTSSLTIWTRKIKFDNSIQTCAGWTDKWEFALWIFELLLEPKIITNRHSIQEIFQLNINNNDCLLVEYDLSPFYIYAAWLHYFIYVVKWVICKKYWVQWHDTHINQDWIRIHKEQSVYYVLSHQHYWI